MKNEILISVIVPVYNAERFIDRAVQSVLCQMDGSVELILVDDGSTDRSGAICDTYAAENPNVHVVHKKNGGLSSARNAGINAANGAYLMFLDADDYLEKEACAEVSKVILATHPDCIDFGWRYVSNGEAMIPSFHKLPKNTLLGEKELYGQILPPLLNLCSNPDDFIFDFSWNKVYLREKVDKHNILFDESRRTWEDRPFVAHYLRYCENYYAMDRCFYNYVDIPGSLSRRYSLDFFRIILANFRHYSDLFGDRFDFDTQYVNDYWCHAIEKMILRSLEEKDNTEQIRKNIRETLVDTQVVRWYAKRNPQNAFEKEMSRMVASGEGEKALSTYEIRWKREQKRESRKAYIFRAKQVVKKLLGR